MSTPKGSVHAAQLRQHAAIIRKQAVLFREAAGREFINEFFHDHYLSAAAAYEKTADYYEQCAAEHALEGGAS
jgi:hypothetical protein